MVITTVTGVLKEGHGWRATLEGSPDGTGDVPVLKPASRAIFYSCNSPYPHILQRFLGYGASCNNKKPLRRGTDPRAAVVSKFCTHLVKDAVEVPAENFGHM